MCAQLRIENMLDDFIKYNETFFGESCILMLFLNEEKNLYKLFGENSKKSKEIIKMIKEQKKLLWIGKTSNSQCRIDDFYSPAKRENSLQESIAQLISGAKITSDKNEYRKNRILIAEWLKNNTVFYARLCSNFDEPDSETIKKNLIKKYNLPFNRKYNKTNFNKILFTK